MYSAFRNKPTLLHRAWDVAVGGDEQDVHLLDRPEMRAVLAEPDLVTRLNRFAEVNTAIMRRTAPLLRALRGAAASETAAAALVAEADGARLEAMGVHAAAAAGTRQLAVSEEECRDVLWSSTDGTLWHRLFVERGWTDDRYATWLSRMWRQCWSRTTRKRVRDRTRHAVTVTGRTFQMSSQYSAIARSDENLPLRAVFRIDIRVHASRSCHAALTRSWQST